MVGAVLNTNEEQFLFDNETLEAPKEKEGGRQMEDTDLYY